MLVDAMQAWMQEQTATKKMEQIWGFAGIPGGGGILNVASPDEADAVMAGFPFLPFSNVTLYALVDLGPKLERTKQVAQQRLAGMAAAR